MVSKRQPVVNLIVMLRDDIKVFRDSMLYRPKIIVRKEYCSVVSLVQSECV